MFVLSVCLDSGLLLEAVTVQHLQARISNVGSKSPPGFYVCRNLVFVRAKAC